MCINPISGCVDASEFVNGVCAGNDNIAPSPPSPMPGETRRAVGMKLKKPCLMVMMILHSCLSWAVDYNPTFATFYVDLFPNTGYPPHLEMRQDLAEFVSHFFLHNSVASIAGK